MILPTMNGEQSDPAPCPVRKAEDRKVGELACECTLVWNNMSREISEQYCKITFG